MQRKDVEAKGGLVLFSQYSSLQDLLKEVYPEYPWLATKGRRLPVGYWDQTANLRHFFDEAAKELGHNKVRDAM